MIGGAHSESVGALHRAAAAKTGAFALVAGCFSRDYTRNLAAGVALGMAVDRIYPDVFSLVAAESKREDGARTPHIDHAAAITEALKADWWVIAEKPLCTSVLQLEQVQRAANTDVAQVHLPLVLRHIPALQRMRALTASAQVGQLQKLIISWLQGGSTSAQFIADDWRFQCRHAGHAGTLADLGTHALDLAAWLSGSTLEFEEVSLWRGSATSVR
jgi:predicted dehydrogenase